MEGLNASAPMCGTIPHLVSACVYREWKGREGKRNVCTSIHDPHLGRASRSMDGRQAAEGWSRCQ